VYSGEEDFLFPSERLNGTKPLTPDMVLKKIIRPAPDRAGVYGKTIEWHSCRHSLATNLRSLGVDVKVSSRAFEAREFTHHKGPLHSGCFCG
jgi:site-specific recombinase XerD